MIASVSLSGKHGFGAHTPTAEPNTPYEQVMVSDAVAVYQLLHTGVQVSPLIVEALQVVE